MLERSGFKPEAFKVTVACSDRGNRFIVFGMLRKEYICYQQGKKGLDFMSISKEVEGPCGRHC